MPAKPSIPAADSLIASPGDNFGVGTVLGVAFGAGAAWPGGTGRFGAQGRAHLSLDGVPEDEWPLDTLLAGVWTVFPHVSMASFRLANGKKLYQVAQLFPGATPETSTTVMSYLAAFDPTDEDLDEINERLINPPQIDVSRNRLLLPLHCGARLLDLCLREGNARLLARSQAANLLLVEPGNNLPFLDVCSFLDRQFDDSARNLECSIHLRQLDVPGDRNRVGILPARPARPRDSRRRNNRQPRRRAGIARRIARVGALG